VSVRRSLAAYEISELREGLDDGPLTKRTIERI
jgi:hypothetical protein